MDKGQERLYELLEEVDQICRKNDITYYIGGGAALGAIRGGGFMPWDDDIDLHITRDNWHKFIKAMETQLPPNREFVCTETDDMYGNPLGRYVDKGTTAMSKSQLMTAKACGKLIEFFVFDPMPKTPEGKTRHRMLVKTYCELLNPYMVANRNILYENSDFSYENYKEYLSRAEKEGMQNILAELFGEITGVPEEKSDAWYMVWARVNHQYPKEMFGNPRYVKFERGMFPVAAMQEHVDRLAYGDSWMYIPYIEGQIFHDNTDCELDIPYQNIVDIYMPLLEKDKLYDAYLSRKRTRVDAMETWAYYRRDGMKLWFDILGKPIIERCNASKGELMDALEKGDYQTVESGIREFMAVQGRPIMKMCGLLFPVQDEFLAVVFGYHIRTGKYYKISGLVKLRRESGKPIPEALEQILDEFDYSRELSVAVYDERDPEQVEVLIGEHPEYSDSIDTLRARLWVMYKRACSEDDFRKLLEEAEAAEERFPDDGEIMRFAAFALYSLGRKAEAESKYEDAVRHTRNGFVWHEAEENCGIDGFELMGDVSEHDRFDEQTEEAGEEDEEDQTGDQDEDQDDDSAGTQAETDDRDGDQDADDEKENAEDDEGEDEAADSQFDPDNFKFRMRRLKELLFEIDDICRENGLKYSVAQKIAISLQENGTLPDEFNNICIVMPLGDLERLEHIVNDEGDGSRVIENIHNNPKADNMSARYVDKGTTLIDFDDYHKHTYHGLFVDIRPIKQYDPANMTRRTYDFYKALWTSAVKNKAQGLSGVKELGVKAALKFMGKQGITERYYQADRDVSLVDTWDDIAKAPAIKCGAFSIRKKSYYKESRFRTFSLKRGWTIEDRIVEGHPVMYCNQFYGRHIRGGAHGTRWILENQMLSQEPYGELITGDIERKLKHVRSLRRKYDKIAKPIPGYDKTIDSAWNIYLMAKELLHYENNMDADLYDKVDAAIRTKDKEKFVTLLEDYFTFLISWRNTGTPVIQIPEIRQRMIAAVRAFYKDVKVPEETFQANDIDKLIVAHTFPYLDEEKQAARLIKAARTGDYDLIDKKDRTAGKAPFVKSELAKKI